MEITEIHSHTVLYWQKIRESNGFTKEINRYLVDLTKSFFSEKIEKVTRTQCGNLRIFPLTIFCKNSVKVTFSLKNYTVSQFDEKSFRWYVENF